MNEPSVRAMKAASGMRPGLVAPAPPRPILTLP